MVLNLLGNDGGVEHVITCTRGLLFDSNDPYAQPLTMSALDRACGMESKSALFKGYSEVLYLTPREKLVRSKARMTGDLLNAYLVQNDNM